jgi:hypothetical protein
LLRTIATKLTSMRKTIIVIKVAMDANNNVTVEDTRDVVPVCLRLSIDKDTTRVMNVRAQAEIRKKFK